MSHKDFTQMMVPSFPSDITNANAMALLKRSAVCINARRYFYFRAPGEDERDVPRLAVFARPDFFKPSAKPIIRQYKRGSKDAPQGYEAAILWEQNWLKEALRKADAPATPAVQKLPMTKTEQQEFFDVNKGLRRACHGQPLDVDSPPRKKIKEEMRPEAVEWKAQAFADVHRMLAQESASEPICCDSPSPVDVKRQGSDFNLEMELSQFIREGAGGASSGSSGVKRARRDGLDPGSSQGRARGPSGSSRTANRLHQRMALEANGLSKDGDEDVFGHTAAGL